MKGGSGGATAGVYGARRRATRKHSYGGIHGGACWGGDKAACPPRCIARPDPTNPLNPHLPSSIVDRALLRHAAPAAEPHGLGPDGCAEQHAARQAARLHLVQRAALSRALNSALHGQRHACTDGQVPAKQRLLRRSAVQRVFRREYTCVKPATTSQATTTSSLAGLVQQALVSEA